jgi:hypothetical protein
VNTHRAFRATVYEGTIAEDMVDQAERLSVPGLAIAGDYPHANRFPNLLDDYRSFGNKNAT